MTGTKRDWLVGVDVGGTFTDGVLIRPGHPALAIKTPTMNHDPVAGLVGCLDEMARAAEVDRTTLLVNTGKFSYGTTQAANMVVEGNGAKTGFITTKGFRDTLVIAGIGRDRIGQDLSASRSPSLVPRHLIHEVSERVDASGDEVSPLNEAEVLAAIESLRTEGVEALGICLLWSFMNPAHERRIAELVRENTDWFISISSDCAPVLGEYERSATTALNARLGPPLSRHLLSVDERLKTDGLAVRPLIMTSAGGLLSLPDAAARPVALLSSGPAGGVLASRQLAQSLGIDNVICGDMGGTTFDVSLISDGEPSRSERGIYAGQEIVVSALDIVSVGAGGGSIAWADRGVRLKVGPQSAGAYPGPACYGRGGRLPTVTDVNLLLGRLNPVALASGQLSLDREASRAALAELGDELGVSAEAAAAGVLEIVDAAMADAIHSQTVARGVDPRDYTIFAFGGGGALHAATIAAELGIRRVVVPQLGPVFSAYGIVASHIQHVLNRSISATAGDRLAIARVVAELEEQGNANLDMDEIAPENRILTRTAQMRFVGQLHSVDVPLPDGLDEVAMRATVDDFVERYERLFGAGTSSPEAGVQVVGVGVSAIGLTQRPPVDFMDLVPSRPEPSGSRETWVGSGFATVASYTGPLAPGARLTGPALIDLPGSTVWVPQDVQCDVDGLGNLNLSLEARHDEHN